MRRVSQPTPGHGLRAGRGRICVFYTPDRIARSLICMPIAIHSAGCLQHRESGTIPEPDRIRSLLPGQDGPD